MADSDLEVVPMDIDHNLASTSTALLENVGIDEKERVITNEFLAGKLSFTEYTTQMEYEDTPDELEAVDEPSTSTQEEMKKPKTRSRRIKRTLPPIFKGLMGEANLRYARGDLITAEQMCYEVIRQVPTAPDPFLTLAQMYETKNLDKSMQFGLIAAYLSPNDDGQWTRLALLSEKIGDLKQADACYAKAINSKSSDITLHLNRIKFLEKTGETKLAVRAKMRALCYMSGANSEILIPMAQALTKYLHSEGEYAKAMEALNFIFKKCPEHVTSETCNIMLELLLQLNNYRYCLEIFVQHCGIELEVVKDIFQDLGGEIEERLRVVSYKLPPELPIDLHIKFIICLIHLHSFELIAPILELLLLEDDAVEKNGDLYLDVAEALMAENRHEMALKLLIPLVKSRNFGLAAVWLRYAECLNACNMHEQAIDSYKKVMELAPSHIAMRYPLAELLISIDRKSEALAILEQEENTEQIDSGLLFKKCRLLKDLKLYSKFWQAGLLLLSRHCLHVRNKDEVEKLTCYQVDRRAAHVRAVRAAKGEDIYDITGQFDNTNEPSTEEEFALFRDLTETCMKKRRYDLMQRFTFTGLSTKKFKDHQLELELIAIFACIYNEDCYHGYNLVRELVQRNLENKNSWNLYNLVIQRADDGRHNRFLMRLLMRTAVDSSINILHANNCLVAGTYKYALSEYISLYRSIDDPLYAFLVGVTFFQIACQKFSTKKEYLVVQGVGFLNTYKKLRGPDGAAEADYNIGRGYHQLGMLHVAIDYYKKVLDAKTGLNPNLFDLKREAAYNLHLIYKVTGAFDLAKMYLYKYIVV